MIIIHVLESKIRWQTAIYTVARSLEKPTPDYSNPSEFAPFAIFHQGKLIGKLVNNERDCESFFYYSEAVYASRSRCSCQQIVYPSTDSFIT
jgi:hypothetical protein